MELWKTVLGGVALVVAFAVCLLTACAVVQSIGTIRSSFNPHQSTSSRNPIRACLYLFGVWLVVVVFGISEEWKIVKRGGGLNEATYPDSASVAGSVVVLCFLLWVFYRPRVMDDEELYQFRRHMLQIQRVEETQPLLPAYDDNHRRELVKNCLIHQRLQQDDTIQSASAAAHDDSQQQDDGNVLTQTLYKAETSLRSVLGRTASMECSICLKPYEVGETVCWAKSDECNHVFHEDCISQWLEQHDQCPLCRVKLLAEGNAEDV